MNMTQGTRKFALAVHVVLSVGWLGAAAAYLALAAIGWATEDAATARAVYVSLELLGWCVLVPFGSATLVAGLVESLATPWGLFRHWWIVAKFALTLVALGALIQHMQAVAEMARLAATEASSVQAARQLRTSLVLHPAGGVIVLLAATVLSIYKPWGLTPYGRRRPLVQRAASIEFMAAPRVAPQRAARRWGYIVGFHIAGLALLFVVFHLVDGGMPHH